MNTNGRMSECVRRENEKMVKRGGGGFRAQRRMKRKEMVRRFFMSNRGVGACLACGLLVRNGLSRTGSYHNVLF